MSSPSTPNTSTKPLHNNNRSPTSTSALSCRRPSETPSFSDTSIIDRQTTHNSTFGRTTTHNKEDEKHTAQHYEYVGAVGLDEVDTKKVEVGEARGKLSERMKRGLKFWETR
ncbi:MAG: hypothetical protein M1834_009087 [Cirrosporium novae-zelandiae]|nr:MAG: hypothetical protein M1834_009087 [Cirrosporium novae-zelandiae]